jgi:hypothetical protein
MRDLLVGKNHTQTIKGKKSKFDSFMFWGLGSRHRKSHSEEIEKSPIKVTEEDSKPQKKKKSKVTSDPKKVKLYETISGNYIITRGWDGNNMWVFRMRKK